MITFSEVYFKLRSEKGEIYWNLRSENKKAMIIQEIHAALRNKLLSDVIFICDKYKGSIVSFGRSVQRNKSVGGSETSWHLDWLAVDIAIDDEKKDKFINIKQIETGLNQSGYRTTETADDGIHVQYDWPIIKDFIRTDIYTHLKLILERYPDIILGL